MSHRLITHFGAVPNGTTCCTAAIQQAIDQCEPGDTVVIPDGTFLTGALFLKSDMTLHLCEGAKLLGSPDPADYPLMVYRFEGIEQRCYASLLNTDDTPQRNIVIEGSGTIDGSGQALFDREMQEKQGVRGRVVCLRNTDGVRISGVTLRQSPAWCLHLIYCTNVTIESIEIHTRYDENGLRYEHIFNGDGIDVDSCQQVRITNCLIASQDDCIAIKSGKDAEGRRIGLPTRNVLIEGCTFRYGFGVAIGSEMSGGVEDVCVRDCRFEDTFSIASIKAIRGRGGYVRRIRYERCTLRNRSHEIRPTRWFRGAIYLDSFYSHETFDADTCAPVDDGTPVVENIVFSDIQAETVEGYGLYLCGLPEAPSRQVVLENVRVCSPQGVFIRNIQALQMNGVQAT